LGEGRRKKWEGRRAEVKDVNYFILLTSNFFLSD
jgi:hypothetical protein